MSGVEVVGIVLGGIPLLISGLEHYAEGVSTIRRWFRYKRELKSLVRFLRAEYVRFLGTCERVLYGLVTGPEMRRMIEEPHSSRWKDQGLDHKLRRRLQQAYGPYIDCVDDMTLAIDKLKADLDLGIDSQLVPVEEKDFKSRFKAIKFALSQRGFNHSIERIKYNNDILANLTSQNLELEPLRSCQRRPASNLFKLVQNHARSLYSVIEKSWHCQCLSTHSANLRLDARIIDEVAVHEQLSMTANNVRFGVVFSSDSTSAQTLPWSWQETEIQPLSIKDDLEPQDSVEEPKSSDLPSDSPDKRSSLGTRPSLRSIFRKGGSPRKSVKFASETERLSGSPGDKTLIAGALSGDSKISEALGVSLSHNDLSKLNEIVNLCQAMQQSTDLGSQNGHCLGYLSSDKKQALTVYLAEAGKGRTNSRTIASFKETLASHAAFSQLVPTRGKLQLTRAERLDIALTVASSTLQLQQTPWLRDDWTMADFFLCKDCTDQTKQQVFVSKAFPANKPTESAGQKVYIGLPRNRTLFALGVFLIEICLGQPFDAMRSPQDPLDADGNSNILTDWSAANRLLQHVEREAGGRYGDAVRRCIHCDFNQRKTDLEDDDFRQAVYEGVVAPLQEVVQDFKSQ